MTQTCIDTEYLSQDEIKAKELESLNLPAAWRQILKLTGPDLFLKIWRVATTPEYMDRNALYVPSINKYYEYQHALYVQSLISQGMTNTQIIEQLKSQNIEMSRTRIIRIRKKFINCHVKAD